MYAEFVNDKLEKVKIYANYLLATMAFNIVLLSCGMGVFYFIIIPIKVFEINKELLYLFPSLYVRLIAFAII